ncbi:hypothetical protein FHS96_002720 [Sphingomonas zeicaulis]|uniref:hypothetical protein n=1 Tax=Sphingomonas zeicaulis TaxID=1632740 RepID=UPI003D220C58
MSLSFRDRPPVSRLLFGAIAAPAAIFAPKCLAQTEVRLEADANVLYSDNPFLSTEKNTDTAAAEIVARPEVEVQLGPGTTIEVGGRAGFRQYSRRYGNFVTGRGDATFRHRDSEYLTLMTNIGYSRELAADVLTDSIDAAVDTRQIREAYGARTSVEYNPNARWQFVTDGGWQKTRYPGSTLLQATNAYDVGLTASRRVSELMTVGLRGEFTSSRIANGGKTEAKSIGVTVARRLNANWRADATAGIEWASLGGLPGIPNNNQNDRSRFSGSVNLCYDPRRMTLCLTGAIRSEVSGLGGLQRETAVGATLAVPTSTRGRVTASADYRRAQLPGFGDTDVLRGSAAYEHRVTETLSVRAGADYLQRTRADGDRVGAVVLQIGVTYRGRDR